MNKEIIAAGILTLVSLTTPVFAETGKDTVRVEKLEERVRDLDKRMAKVEEDSHKQMGMMQQHGAQAQQPGTGMNGPMGQAPQQNMPQGNMQQQPQGGAMPPMGDM